MSNEFYIAAGIIPVDDSDPADSNTFYISAGLVPDDYESGQLPINCNYNIDGISKGIGSASVAQLGGLLIGG